MKDYSKPRFEIDELNLQRECRDHAAQYLFWSEKLANDQFAYDEKKRLSDKKFADTEVDVRENPDNYKIAKLTESVVAAVVRSQPDVDAALRAVSEARRVLESTRGVLNALEHRKRMLTLLTDLWTHSYYTQDTPSSRNAAPQRTDGPLSEEEKARVRRGRRVVDEAEHDE